MSVVTTTFIISDYYSPRGDGEAQQKVDPTKVWVTFAGTFTQTGTPQTAGSRTLDPTSHWQSLPLSDMKARVSLPYFRSSPQQYTFALNGFSGRVYVNFGATPLSEAPDPGNPGTSPYIVFEPTVSGSGNSNMDLSYVDGVSCAASLQTCDAVSGAALPALSVNPVTTAGDIVNKVAGAVPAAAIVKNTEGHIVRIMSSAAAPGAYHDWTDLMTVLQTSGTKLNVSSYQVPRHFGIPAELLVGAGTLFGYSGALAQSGQYPGFDKAQHYNTTAVFAADLNPQNNQTLAALGVPQGTAGVKLSGKGHLTEAFDIYITGANLNAGVGIYGNNPAYVVISPAYQNGYATTGIVDDLGGRIVGDLMAGIVFGWAASTTNIESRAYRTGTNFYKVAWSAPTVGGLSTGELFFLLSLAGAQKKLSQWIGPALDRNGLHYDRYLNAVSACTYAYASGFTDRLQGFSSPDLYWYTTDPPTIPWKPPAKFPTVGFVSLSLGAPHKQS